MGIGREYEFSDVIKLDRKLHCLSSPFSSKLYVFPSLFYTCLIMFHGYMMQENDMGRIDTGFLLNSCIFTVGEIRE